MHNSVLGIPTVLFILFANYFLSLRINKKKSTGYIIIFTFVYFLFQLQLTTLLLGTIGLLKPLLLFYLNIIISSQILLYAFNISIFKSIYKKININNILEKIKSFGFAPIFFLVLFLLNALTIFYRITILPQSVWDVNTYHLIAPIHWYQNEIIPKSIITPINRVNNYFLGNKIFDYWNILLSESLLYTELTQFVFALVLFYTIYLIMRRISISKQNSLIFSVIAVSFPTILMQMRTTHDHMPLLTLTFILLYVLINLITLNKRLELIDIINLLVLCSLIIAIKINGFVYLFIVLITLLLTKNIHLVKTFKTLRIKKIFSKLRLSVFFLVLACIYVAGYWPIRNYQLHKNFLGGELEYMNIKAEETNNIWNFIRQFIDKLDSNLMAAPKRLVDINNNYDTNLENVSGYGIQFLSIAVPAYFLSILLLLSQIKFNKDEARHRAVKFLIFFAFINQLILYSLYFSPFNYRLFTVFPILAIILAGFLWSMQKHNKTQKNALNLLLFFIIIFNFFIMPTVEATTGDRFKNAFKGQYFSHTSDYVTYLDNDWKIINLLPADKTIVYYTGADGFVLPYYDLNLKTKTIALDEFAYELENQVLSFPEESIIEMSNRKINYLHISNMGDLTEVADSDYFKHIYGGLYEFVYDK